MANGDIPSTPIEFLKGVGPDRAETLKKDLGVFTFYDLLNIFPFRYVDRTQIYPISELIENMPYCQVSGTITKVTEVGQSRAKRLQAVLKDESGTIDLVWFQGIRWIKKMVVPGAKFVVFGKPTVFNKKLNIVHPEIDFTTPDTAADQKAGLQPVYSSTESLKSRGLDSKGIARLQETLLTIMFPVVKETLPDFLISRYRLMPRATAYVHIHFPENMEKQKKAENRLKFEELFYLQMKILLQRIGRQEKVKGRVFEKVGVHFNTFYNEHLPFELTGAQKRVLKELREDLRKGLQMNRLLQGDVGSGKTVVALMSMLLALDNGAQACLMVPTEILAVQHFQNIRRLLGDMEVDVKLLTGSTNQAERKRIAETLSTGQLSILIGTHALLEKWVDFPNLGLVVIDEQHRFGVAQRAILWKKNTLPPHVLVMTATPIPRTLAMTLYGDLETSVLDELPPGRKEIKTAHRYEKERSAIYAFIKEQIREGRQAYIVYPLIEESEKLDYQNLQSGFDELLKVFPLPLYRLGMVHGRMNAADKEFEMQRFKKGETHVLVSTTVIEVGVDVPNASVMVIESAERFGLSQLHQLRGRVGRSGNQSYCILLTSHKLTMDARTRMDTMARTNDGFEIAEVDLQLRGPGDMAGTQQSGVLALKLANIVTDQRILTAARQVVLEILDDDPHLQKEQHIVIRKYIETQTKGQPNWSLIS
ncbi:MAG: ATP-dependent DNA helicase RecG [Bacteroidota bacterium]|nr:ATP-dependent DNA helicase RecG [Bacteroidota bacterium]